MTAYDDIAEDMAMPSYPSLTANEYQQKVMYKKRPVAMPSSTTISTTVIRSEEPEGGEVLESTETVTKEKPKAAPTMAGVQTH